MKTVAPPGTVNPIRNSFNYGIILIITVCHNYWFQDPRINLPDWPKNGDKKRPDRLNHIPIDLTLVLDRYRYTIIKSNYSDDDTGTSLYRIDNISFSSYHSMTLMNSATNNA